MWNFQRDERENGTECIRTNLCIENKQVDEYIVVGSSIYIHIYSDYYIPPPVDRRKEKRSLNLNEI